MARIASCRISVRKASAAAARLVRRSKYSAPSLFYVFQAAVSMKRQLFENDMPAKVSKYAATNVATELADIAAKCIILKRALLLACVQRDPK